MGIAAQLTEQIDGLKVLDWEEVSQQQESQVLSAITITTDHSPSCIAFPNSTEQLSQIVALANTNSWRMLVTGQSSKLGWGGLASGIDLVISTAQLNQVIDHAIGDFTITVQPGLKFTDLQQQLTPHRQLLAIDPAFSTEATLGGIVATADAGSLRQRYGGLRDMLIGIKFIRYDGEEAKAGGRVVKNVAGYDLMKLMTGAYGSLGIISELTFRLYPMQATSRTLVLSAGEQAIERAIAEVRMSGLTPVALDLTLSTVTAQLTGKAVKGAHMSLIARFQGIADGVEEQTTRLQKIATTHSIDVQQLDGEPDEAYWQKVSELVQPDTVLCKVGMRPSSLPALLAQLENYDCSVMLHGSSGLGWVQWSGEQAGSGQLVREIEWVRSHTQNNGGFLTLLQAPAKLKTAIDIWGYNGNALKVMSDIKDKFDPNKLLSPGRFVGGL